MKIAGLGFRQSASTDDLRAALQMTGCPRPDALASVAAKATAPQMPVSYTHLTLPTIYSV